MKRFARLLFLACVTCVLVSSPPARAHHYIGTCAEVGEWNKSASARLGEYNRTMEVLAYVGWAPPAANCDDGGVFRTSNFATQHTSLHARRLVSGTEYCLETVGQRFNNGWLRLYGYNCSSGGSIHDLGYYNNPWIYFWMSSGGTYDWQHWYYRYDTNQWVFMGTTHSPCCRYYNSWLESSGYNESSTRGTYFRGFRETRSDGGSGTSNFPCPVTQDFDRHQEEFPNVGGLAENTDWRPATVNSC